VSLKIRRIAVVIATLASVGGMAVAAPPASAALRITPTFTNWPVAGSLTVVKSDQTVTLAKGSAFNGSGEIFIENPEGTILASGTLTGTVTVPPFKATLTLPILGIPTPVDVGVTFTQDGPAVGTLKPAPPASCSTPEGACVSLSVPTKANIGFTVLGVLGIKAPLFCQTSEPLSIPLTETATLLELTQSLHFSGTTTIPSIKCPGLQGLLLGPILTTTLSGPDNPYSITITPPEAGV
jgi:hypothetical protein